MTEFKLWIIKICVAVIFILICDMLVPKGFKNVCNMVLGIILIVVITSPVARFVANGENFWDKVLKNNNFLDRSNIYINKSIMDVQNRNANNLYSRQVSEQLKLALKKAFLIEDISVQIHTKLNDTFSIDKVELQITKKASANIDKFSEDSNKKIQALNEAVRIRFTNNIKKFTAAFLNVNDSQIFIKLS